MKNSSQSVKTFSRRSFVIGTLQLGLVAVLAGRLAWLQVSQGTRYKTLSDKNRINLRMLAPSRGQVFDRYGTPLAVNEQSFRVLIVPEQAGNVERVLRELKQFIELNEATISRIVKQSKKQAKFLPLEVKGDLSWDDVAKIEVNLPDLAGLSIDTGETRRYPHGADTAHVIGYVSVVSRAELDDNPLLSLPGFKTGKTGVEKYYDERLRGQAGTSQVEVNATGREVRELTRNEPVQGASMILNLDVELQDYVQQRLSSERSASAVIMDVVDGSIYAMVSTPGFDANEFIGGISANTWEELLANPGKPLNNKALTGQYPPASTFKMITALAAFEAGVITKHTKKYCPGYYELGGHRFHCWKTSGHGEKGLVDALAESCDTFFYEISVDTGIEKIAAMARRFGIGEIPDIDIAEARSGLMPDKDWKMGHFGESWRIGETVVASIGQSYILTTPLQLAVMTARLVNGGKAVNPRMAGYISDQNYQAPVWPDIGIKKEYLDVICQGMNKVVNSSTGTAHDSQIEKNAFRMGGKTGTAQVKRITMAQRMAGFEHDDLPWKHRHHALFVGYAPIDNPRYVCSVVIEHGGGGSSVAAPVARDLLLKTQERAPAKQIINPGVIFTNG